jgi:hypothetical protein
MLLDMARESAGATPPATEDGLPKECPGRPQVRSAGFLEREGRVGGRALRSGLRTYCIIDQSYFVHHSIIWQPMSLVGSPLSAFASCGHWLRELRRPGDLPMAQLHNRCDLICPDLPKVV